MTWRDAAFFIGLAITGTCIGGMLALDMYRVSVALFIGLSLFILAYIGESRA